MADVETGTSRLGLLPVEPETVRVAAIGDPDEPTGAACLVSDRWLLTCEHVVRELLGRDPQLNDEVPVTLLGVATQPQLRATVSRIGHRRHESDFARDLLLLSLPELDRARLAFRPAEFATPLSHTGKTFSVMGFPAERPFGLHASGQLRAADRDGIVQMDGSSALAIAPGYSGAPVWCRDVRAFVGLVVASEDDRGLAWCVPSRVLCRFLPELLVKFRIPKVDRPIINDYDEDDPNAEMFGEVNDNGSRRLTARFQKDGSHTTVHVRYTCLPGSEAPRGEFVTFITHPSFEWKKEDAYELFARVENGVAEQSFRPIGGFTVAAIGDVGDTALTLDLCKAKGKPAGFC